MTTKVDNQTPRAATPPPQGRLRLSIDASAVPNQPTGAGHYVIEITRALSERADVDLTVFCRRGDGARWTVADTVVERAPLARPVRLAWEQVELPRLLGDMPIEVHHCPHYTMPERARVPRVVTIHDMTFFDHPEWHERPKVLYFRHAIRAAAAKANALITPSRRAAERIQASIEVVAPLHVVPHGVDHQRFRPAESHEADYDQAVLERLGVRTPYVAFVGTLEPRKDVPTLVRAFDRIAGTIGDLSLVLAGGEGWGTAAVDQAVASSTFSERIVRVGYMAEEDKPALLRRAQTVTYPSQEEGFGLPVLEALACGAPLVTTRGSAMEEVAGGSALLVEAGDVDELAAAIEASVAGGQEVQDRRREGLAVASGYTWDAAANRHLEIFRSVT